MITKLTKYQEEQLEIYRDKWTKIGLSTDRINRDEAKKTIDDLYTKILSKDAPKDIVFLDSPLATFLCMFFYNLMKKEFEQVEKQVKKNIQKGNRRE